MRPFREGCPRESGGKRQTGSRPDGRKQLAITGEGDEGGAPVGPTETDVGAVSFGRVVELQQLAHRGKHTDAAAHQQHGLQMLTNSYRNLS